MGEARSATILASADRFPRQEPGCLRGLVLHTQWRGGRGTLSSPPPQSREAKLRPLPRLGFSRFCDIFVRPSAEKQLAAHLLLALALTQGTPATRTAPSLSQTD